MIIFTSTYSWDEILKDAVELRESSYWLHVANLWELFCADADNTGADPAIIIGHQIGNVVREM